MEILIFLKKVFLFLFSCMVVGCLLSYCSEHREVEIKQPARKNRPLKIPEILGG